VTEWTSTTRCLAVRNVKHLDHRGSEAYIPFPRVRPLVN
jgi:hypothetical protein